MSEINLNIENKIFTIRGKQVMLDHDLTDLYGVEIKRLGEQVKRNKNRFPDEFRFQLTKDEYDYLRSQIATLDKSETKILLNASLKMGQGKHRKYLPFVFTEQGVAMLSAVLRSETAVKVSIHIIHAFVEMKKFIVNNAVIFQRLDIFQKKHIHIELYN